MTTRVLVATAILCTLSAAAPVRARASQRLLTGYSVSTWGDWNGVPLGPVYAIAQDLEGYLWIGGANGVRRFDGVRFSDAASLGLSLPEAPVFALRVTGAGALWIGFGDGRGVRVIRDGVVDASREMSLGASITEIVEDASGCVWAASDKGLFRYRSRWEEIPLAGGASGQPVLRVSIGQRGVVRVGTASGLQERDSTGTFREVLGVNGPVYAISEDAVGRVWVSDPVGGFRLATAPRPTLAALHGRGYFVFHDSAANLWIGTHGQGLWRVRHDADSAVETIEVATVQTGLISNGIWEIAEDRDGNIWVGTNRGLHRLARHTMTPLTEVGLVRAVDAADTGVWLATPGAVVRLTPAGTVGKRITLSGGADPTALSADGSGALWIATDRQVWQLVGDKLRGPIVDAGHAIRSIAGDGAGGVWLLDAAGELRRWREGQPTAVPLRGANVTSQVRFMHVDRERRLWVGADKGPLLLIGADGTARTVEAANGPFAPSPAAVNSAAEDRHGTLWIGTSRGLARFREGRLDVLTTATGTFAQAVRALVVDDLGYVWLGVGTSIARLDPAEFEQALAQAAYTPRLREFDVADGVNGVMFASGNGAAARAADGRLFFVTGRGITMADPHVVNERLRPPPCPVRIQSAYADDGRYTATDTAILPSGTSHLRIDYTVATLSAPDRARFRYRLDGFDRGWIDAGIRRQAFYTNLPSGEYRFVVQVQTPEHAWTSEPTAWTFRIAPMFYESLWFYAVCAAAFVLAATGMWRMRVRSLHRELAAVYGERMRLGREIHDTLLQSLVGLALQLDAVEHLGAVDHSRVPSQLARIRTQIEEHVRELRLSIWDLRSSPPRPRAFAEALADGLQPLVPEAVQLEIDVGSASRPLSERTERELLRIAREAVINAVRHGRPRHIAVRVACEPSMLRLTVEDDGCGCELAAVPSSDGAHYGLIAMSERAKTLGGECTVTSSAGAGTRVAVVVPLRRRWRRPL